MLLITPRHGGGGSIKGTLYRTGKPSSSRPVNLTIVRVVVGCIVSVCQTQAQEAETDRHIIHKKYMPIRIAQIHRIAEAVHIPVGADAGDCRVPPVALGEQPQLGVVGAGVEVDEAGLGVEALADIGLALGLAERVDPLVAFPIKLRGRHAGCSRGW
jgi:hypothetical protein